MSLINAEQIRGARAMLNWTQGDLASVSGLALNTIRSIESGKISPRDQTFKLIHKAIEKEGLEFIPDGVKRRKSETWTLTDQEGCQALYNDMLQTSITGDCDEVVAFVDSYEMFSNIFCGRPDWLHKINEFANIKCLILEDVEHKPGLENIKFRKVVSGGNLFHYCFVYGNRHVMVVPLGKDCFRFVFYMDSGMASFHRIQFDLIWGGTEGINKPVKLTKVSG